jgi:dinuclear metal center YbgI/SA1388 family protein
MKISAITRFLETLAPPVYQEDYDNTGLQLGSEEEECSGVMISLDPTDTVVEEAAKRGCNLVISHHPLIFRDLKQISPSTGQGRAIVAAVRNNITVYAIHTNLDNVLPGVNSTMADRLGLINREFLLPGRQGDAKYLSGSGLIGDVPEPLHAQQFLGLLRQRFGIPAIRHSRFTGRSVKRVALCGGAGSFLITNALSKGADFFVSADIRYHSFFEAEDRMVIADIGHYESEQFSIDLLHDAILKKFPNFAVLKAGVPTNPVHYYI